MFFRKRLNACILFAVVCPGSARTGLPAHAAERNAAPQRLIKRSYREGESLGYTMRGVNQGHLQTRRYEARATGFVHREADGVFVEDFGWSDLSLNGAGVTLPPESNEFRQRLSLAPDFKLAVPGLSKVQPVLIGPITDLLTFYADVQLAARQPRLQHAGDHVYVSHGTPNSWADGRYTLLGQDSIDFDLLLKDVDPRTHVVTLQVRHVPPVHPQVALPVEWMRRPVGRAENNWVEVETTPDGRFAAEVGEERFEALIELDQASGKIISAALRNPVEVLERDCEDAALHSCGAPVRYRIYREIHLASIDAGVSAGPSSRKAVEKQQP